MNHIQITYEPIISPLLVVLSTIFTGILLISNILANNLLSIGGIIIDGGTLVFSLTYVLSNIISEVYGYKWTRRTSWLSLLLSGVMALLIKLVSILPSPEWYESFFALALDNTWRIVLASLSAWCLGMFINDRVFHHLRLDFQKQKTVKGFVPRALASSLCGNIVDTTVFCFIAFTFIVPSGDLFRMIIAGIIIKTAYELVLTPVTYKLVKKVGAYERRYNG